MITRNKRAFTVILALACSAAYPAFAELENNGSVNTPVLTESAASSGDIPVLAKPSALPIGKPIVSTAFDPKKYSLMTLTLGAKGSVVYKDNIYRSSSDEQEDIIGVFSPKVRLKANLEKHALDFALSPEFGHYFSEDKNDYSDWTARARGRYDISLTESLSVAAGYKYGHVAIGSFEDEPSTALSEPVTYDLYQLEALLKGTRNLVFYQLQGNFDSYDFDDTSREDGTISIQDDRDHDTSEAIAKLGYTVGAPYVLYARGAFNDRSYDERIDSSLAFTRDSDGIEAAIGFMRQVPGEPFSFDAYVGYFDQRYDASELPNVDGLDAYLDLKWNVTTSDLVNLTLDREVKDTSVTGVSGTLLTTVGAEYTHTYNEKLSFGGSVSYGNSDYETNLDLAAIDREDDIYDAGLGARYKLTPNAELSFDYSYRSRESNQADTDYDAHSIGASLSVSY